MTVYDTYIFSICQIILHYHMVRIIHFERFHKLSGSFVKRFLLEEVNLLIVEFIITSMGKKSFVHGCYLIGFNVKTYYRTRKGSTEEFFVS